MCGINGIISGHGEISWGPTQLSFDGVVTRLTKVLMMTRNIRRMEIPRGAAGGANEWLHDWIIVSGCFQGLNAELGERRSSFWNTGDVRSMWD